MDDRHRPPPPPPPGPPGGPDRAAGPRPAAARRPRNRASLLLPQTIEDVIVDNEDVFYEARQHWASVLQPAYETFIVLLFVIWLVGSTTPGAEGNSGVVTFILLAAAAHLVIVTITGGRPPVSTLASDPFVNAAGQRGFSRSGFLVSITFVLLTMSLAGLQATVMLVVVLVMGRLIVILVRWWSYERRYITNRRLIETGGFLGSRISSMPLSRVTDISYSRTIPGEVLGYATMRVETAGQEQALGVVRFIADPNVFYDVLVNFSAPKTSPDDAPPTGNVDRDAF